MLWVSLSSDNANTQCKKVGISLTPSFLKRGNVSNVKESSARAGTLLFPRRLWGSSEVSLVLTPITAHVQWSSPQTSKECIHNQFPTLPETLNSGHCLQLFGVLWPNGSLSCTQEFLWRRTYRWALRCTLYPCECRRGELVTLAKLYSKENKGSRSSKSGEGINLCLW